MVEYKEKNNNSRNTYYKVYANGGSKRITKDLYIKKGGFAPVSPAQQWSGPNDPAPAPAHNGGLYPLGEEFNGPWGNIPVTPTGTNMMDNLASANPPPGYLDQMPGYIRLGNNHTVSPSLTDFSNTTTIKCGTGGGKKKSKKVINKKNIKTGGSFLEGLTSSFNGLFTAKKEDTSTSNTTLSANNSATNSTLKVINNSVSNSTLKAINNSAPNSNINVSKSNNSKVLPTNTINNTNTNTTLKKINVSMKNNNNKVNNSNNENENENKKYLSATL